MAGIDTPHCDLVEVAGKPVLIVCCCGRAGAVWTHAPAYDLNRTLSDLKARVLRINIDLDKGTCSLDLLMSACDYFELSLWGSTGDHQRGCRGSTNVARRCRRYGYRSRWDGSHGQRLRP